MSTETMTESAPAPSPDSAVRRAPLYGRLWRGVPRELGFLLPLLPIGVAGLAITSSIFFTGAGMIFILSLIHI